MADYPKSDGAIFPNDKKTQQNQPDYRGHLVITGDQIRMIMAMAKAGLEPRLQIAAWHKTSNGGKQYMSLAAEAYAKDVQVPPPSAPRQAPPPPKPAPAANNDFDDLDIPFD